MLDRMWGSGEDVQNQRRATRWLPVQFDAKAWNAGADVD
jgi:hypothetical protein